MFRIAAPDYETSLFAPLLASANPVPRFVFRPLIRAQAIEALAASDINIAIGYLRDRNAGCETTTLFEEDYLVVARTGHPALDSPLDLDRYVIYAQVLAAPSGTLSGIVDHGLSKTGRTRRVAIAVPYFLAALATVARTDLIATVPRRIALLNAASFGLGTATPPMPIRRFSVRMIWSRRSNTDPAVCWLRNVVENTAGRLP